MNVALRGKTKQILETMVEEGYANTQSEAIRLAIINFGNEHLAEEEVRLVNKGIEIEMQEIREGKTKTKNLAALQKKYGL